MLGLPQYWFAIYLELDELFVDVSQLPVIEVDSILVPLLRNRQFGHQPFHNQLQISRIVTGGYYLVLKHFQVLFPFLVLLLDGFVLLHQQQLLSFIVLCHVHRQLLLHKLTG